MSAIKNLIGQRFGKLFVVSRCGSNKRGEALWECQCDCGKIIIHSRCGLLSGHTKSCGCLARELSRKRHEINLIGKVFGDWVVLSEGPRKYPYFRKTWKCKCKCGVEKIVNQYTLIHNKSTGCSCSADKRTGETKIKNLIGQRFYRLTVIAKDDSNKYGRARWKCKCDCGNETIVGGNALLSENTKSCGCMLSDKLTMFNQQSETIDKVRMRAQIRWMEQETKNEDSRCNREKI